MKLENQIISDLTNFNKTDLEQDDEKEQKKILEFYQKLDVTSQEATEKMQEISSKLEKIIPDLKVLLYPDETKWQTWNATDFHKFVFLSVFEAFRFVFLLLDGLKAWILYGKRQT